MIVSTLCTVCSVCGDATRLTRAHTSAPRGTCTYDSQPATRRQVTTSYDHSVVLLVVPASLSSDSPRARPRTTAARTLRRPRRPSLYLPVSLTDGLQKSSMTCLDRCLLTALLLLLLLLLVMVCFPPVTFHHCR